MTEKKHIQWLLNELPGLRQQLVISEETEKAVRTHYEKRIAASRNYFPLALAILGLTLIAGGITLIFNYNWDMLSQEWQTAVSFLPLALGAGMAFPWPLLAGGFAVMPKPGRWMQYVKYAFGVMIIGLGLYYAYLAYDIGTAGADDPGRSIRMLKDALRKSAREKKPLLLDFRAEWCKNCKAMEQTTFKSQAVAAELEKFIFVPFDATDISSPEVSSVLKRFGVSGLPSFLIVQGK